VHEKQVLQSGVLAKEKGLLEETPCPNCETQKVHEEQKVQSKVGESLQTKTCSTAEKVHEKQIVQKTTPQARCSPEEPCPAHCKVSRVHEEQEVQGQVSGKVEEVLGQATCCSQNQACQVHEKQALQGCLHSEKACCFQAPRPGSCKVEEAQSCTTRLHEEQDVQEQVLCCTPHDAC
jgi:hypothetical protein